MEIDHLHPGINPSCHVLSSVIALYMPLTSQSTNSAHIEHVPDNLPPEDTSNEEFIDRLKHYLKCTPYSTSTKADREFVRVDNPRGNA
jgi:hypothetical protein